MEIFASLVLGLAVGGWLGMTGGMAITKQPPEDELFEQLVKIRLQRSLEITARHSLTQDIEKEIARRTQS